MAGHESTDYGNVDFESFMDILRKAKDETTNCTPLPHDFFDKYSPNAHSRQVGVSAAFGVICVVGLIANIIVLFLLLTGGRKGATFKAPSTILIMNLAVADILFLLTLPFSISQRLHRGWRFGTVMCKFEEGVKFLNYYGSIFFITAMAVDRYWVIRHPATSNRKVARRYMWIASAVLWCLSLISVLPLLIFAGVDDHGFCSIMFPRESEIEVQNPNNALEAMAEEECLEHYLYYDEYDEYYTGGKTTLVKAGESGEESSYLAGSGSVQDYEDYFDHAALPSESEFTCQHPNVKSLHIWLIWNFIIGFVVPFVIISCCYIRIMKLHIPLTSLAHQRNNEATDSANNNIVRNNDSGASIRDDVNKLISSYASPTMPNASTQRAKILMNVLVPCLIIAFAVCWLPYHALHLTSIRGVTYGNSATCHILRDVTFCLAFFNSALNPILNSFFLFNFKQRLQQSSTWVSGRLKNLSLKRKPSNRNGEARTSLYDDAVNVTNAAEMTIMTTAMD